MNQQLWDIHTQMVILDPNTQSGLRMALHREKLAIKELTGITDYYYQCQSTAHETMPCQSQAAQMNSPLDFSFLTNSGNNKNNSNEMEEQTEKNYLKMINWKINFEHKIRELVKKTPSILLQRKAYQRTVRELSAADDQFSNNMSIRRQRIQRKFKLADKMGKNDDSCEGKDAGILMCKVTGKQFLCLEELFDQIHRQHILSGHNQWATLSGLERQFANVNFPILAIYLEGCPTCSIVGVPVGHSEAKGTNGAEDSEEHRKIFEFMRKSKYRQLIRLRPDALLCGLCDHSIELDSSVLNQVYFKLRYHLLKSHGKELRIDRVPKKYMKGANEID